MDNNEGIITLEGENGELIDMQVVEMVEFRGNRYVLLQNTDEKDEDSYIFRFTEDVDFDRLETISDEKTGLVWQKTSSTLGKSWEDAIQYCENLILANKLNWRLPNQKELQSIIDYTVAQPTFYSGFEGPYVGTDGYWSSTTVFDFPSAAWTTDFHMGNTTASMKSNLNYVRCVSSGGQEGSNL